MRYEMMLPHQIRAAIAANVPAVLPLGVLEYHGEHLAVGMDTLAVTKALDVLEKEAEIVILPPFYYGAASYAVAPPEGTGSVQVDSDVLHPFARELFTGLLRVGFRNIHVFIHHQSENFTTGMPTDLAFKLGARQAIFAFLEKTRGEGWWGGAGMADYYAQQAGGDDPHPAAREVGPDEHGRAVRGMPPADRRGDRATEDEGARARDAEDRADCQQDL